MCLSFCRTGQNKNNDMMMFVSSRGRCSLSVGRPIVSGSGSAAVGFDASRHAGAAQRETGDGNTREKDASTGRGAAETSSSSPSAEPARYDITHTHEPASDSSAPRSVARVSICVSVCVCALLMRLCFVVQWMRNVIWPSAFLLLELLASACLWRSTALFTQVSEGPT